MNDLLDPKESVFQLQFAFQISDINAEMCKYWGDELRI